MAALAHTALLLIDNQVGFTHPTHWGPPNSRSNPSYETNITTLLTAFRAANRHISSPLEKATIIHICHHSLDSTSELHPSSDGIRFLPFAEPKEADGELVISKQVNSSFIGTNLEEALRARGIRKLVIAGLTTDHCVSTTTRMAANLHVTQYTDEGGKEQKGEVVLVEDACATFPRGPFDAETVHKVQIESLRGEFCEVMTTKEAVKRFV